MGTLLNTHLAWGKLKWDVLTSRVFFSHKTEEYTVFATYEDPRGRNVSLQFTYLATWLLTNIPIWFNAVAQASTTSGMVQLARLDLCKCCGCEVWVCTCALHDLVPPTVWNASLNKWLRLKQSIQLVLVPLSSWHNAVLGTQLDKVCYYSITHSSTSSLQSSHPSPALDRLPALPLQVWLTGLDLDGPPTSTLS